jgi:hypothetical protein
MRPASTEPPTTPTAMGPSSRDPKADPPTRSEPDVTPDAPGNTANDDHEGATEAQVGDLTGPGAGYDEGSRDSKRPRREPGIAS